MKRHSHSSRFFRLAPFLTSFSILFLVPCAFAQTSQETAATGTCLECEQPHSSSVSSSSSFGVSSQQGLQKIVRGLRDVVLCQPIKVLHGMASYYSKRFAGRPTSSGEPYDPSDLTAAHMTLPLDTKVIVKNVETGSQVEVKVNDRGKFKKGRAIDLSYRAAQLLGIVGSGVAPVEIWVCAKDNG